MYKPEVTVACVIEFRNQFLFVEEVKQGRLLLNNPAGHLERGESLLAAAEREVFEETGLSLTPQGLIGVYLAPTPDPEVSYLRFCFYYQFLNEPPKTSPNDSDISGCIWLNRNELLAQLSRHRSSLVMRCVDDYIAGIRAPLALLQYCPD